MVAVLMPHPEPADAVASPTPVAPRLATLAGRTIGIVNNSCHCMDVVTEELRRALYADYAVAEVMEVKISAAQTLPRPSWSGWPAPATRWQWWRDWRRPERRQRCS
jgi:hypothetical protein